LVRVGVVGKDGLNLLVVKDVIFSAAVVQNVETKFWLCREDGVNVEVTE